ncbi:MAG: S8 family peptidase [Bacteroidales bacterium]|nr:S8 family peptidase [Bacteroidales bacterium]MDD4544466.1 S8 family peptidase [Bacteroidales bacterium]
MKRIVFFLFSFLFSFNLISQEIGSGLRGYISNTKSKNQELFFSQRYPIRVINNESYLPALIKANDSFSESNILSKGCLIGSKIGNIYTLYIPLDRVEEVINTKGILEIEISRKITNPNVKKGVDDLNADWVNEGYNLPRGFDGKDVIIGVTDWGFDYTHPNFYDTSLTQYRIIGAWDQFREYSSSNNNYSYGRVFIGENELIAAGSDTNNIYNVGYHGTHVAGIASGGGGGSIYRGVAPNAQLLFATFLIDEAALLDAYSWMNDMAEQRSKRLVINGSWGLYNFGILDGTSLFDQAISSLSNSGVVFVSSGGNNGDAFFHINTNLTNNEIKRTGIEFDFNTNPNYWGQSVLIIGDSNNSFSSRLEIYSSTMQLLDSSSWTNTFDNDVISNSYKLINGDSVIFRLSSTDFTPISKRGVQEWEIRISNPLSGIKVVLAMKSDNANIHAWNVANLVTGVGNWGNKFESKGVNYLFGDNNYGVGEPAVCDDVISISAHQARVKNGFDGGARAVFASKGPRIDEAIRPEVSAPGVGVISSINSFATDIDGFPNTYTVEFNNKTYKFYPLSGTSMSSPMVAGVVALMLEANPELSPSQIKEILKETARSDEYTGSSLPNNTWGWGKVDAYSAVERAIQLIGIKDIITLDNRIKVYPNPAKDVLNIESQDFYNIKIMDIYGREVIKTNTNTNRIDVSKLEEGIYFIHFSNKDKAHISKIILQ